MTNDFQALEGPRGSTADAVLYGAIAATLATIAWLTLIHATDREYGLVAIGVGAVVGLAVRAGMRGQTTAGHRVLAVVLTYLAIVGAQTIYASSVVDVELSLSAWLVMALGFPLLALYASFADGLINLVFLALALRFAWTSARARDSAVSG
jgi:hypothetical protein